MTELKPELAPCPFCSSRAVGWREDRQSYGCDYCGCRGPFNDKDTRVSKIASWNTRSPQSLTEKVKLSEPDKEEPIASEYWGQGIKWAKYHGYIKQSLNQASQEDLEDLTKLIQDICERHKSHIRPYSSVAEAILKEYILIKRLNQPTKGE